jgi:DNA-binding transcriptional regulator YiaG
MSKLVDKNKTAVRTAQKSGKLVMHKPAHVSTDRIIRGLREDFGVNQSMMVRLSGYSPRSIISWSKGTKATKPAAIKFTELSRLFEALADLTQNREEVTAWLETPNEAFDGSTPLQVIERGESDRLWRMIYFLRSGEPS